MQKQNKVPLHSSFSKIAVGSLLYSEHPAASCPGTPEGLTVDVDEIRHYTNTTFTATEVLPILPMTTLPSGGFQGVQAAGDEVLRKMNAR